MKKICVVTKVKNDADIIESFCRYYLNFVDNVIIYDDNSTDGTPNIVRCLIEEGLSVELVSLPPKAHLSASAIEAILQKHNEIILSVFKTHEADWILRLDVDEFLYCESGNSPRDEIEKLDENTEYRFYWRTSIYSKDPDDSTVFLPNFFSEYRDPALESFSKTAYSRHLIENMGASYNVHSITFSNKKNRELVRIVDHRALRIAHFPIRSISHALVKTVCMHIRSKLLRGFNPIQYGAIYKQIKETGIPSPEQIRRFSAEYALNPEQLQEPIKTFKQFRGALKADFLPNDIRLLYTDYKNNFMEPILSFFELVLETTMGEYGKKKILYGAGFYGKKALSYYGADRVYAFADRNKHGTEYLGKRVVSLSAPELLSGEYRIVICVEDRVRAEASLNSIGVNDFEVFYKISKG